MSLSFTQDQLLGLDDSHLISLPAGHRLTAATAMAFHAMQRAASDDGLELAVASGYRSFARQLQIWNGKFSGELPLLDADSRPLDASRLGEQEKIAAILRWSALPGTSRHHWGTDLDIYAPNLLPAGQRLQLEPWEYRNGGYFTPLSSWLDEHMAEYGFFRPYTGTEMSSVANEPWHLSFAPESHQAEMLLTAESLAACLQAADIAGKACILAILPQLWRQLFPSTREVTP